MNLDNLLFKILEDFILECVCDKVEEITELSEILKDIKYLDKKNELITKVTKCEILDIDDAFVINYSVTDNFINIKYRLNFIMQTFINNDFLWRIQGTADLIFSIPYTNDWLIFDNKENDFFHYYRKYKNLLKFHKILYNDIECDTFY